jgi:hypothetical protein
MVQDFTTHHAPLDVDRKGFRRYCDIGVFPQRDGCDRRRTKHLFREMELPPETDRDMG